METRGGSLPLSTCFAAPHSVRRKVRQRRQKSHRAPRSAISFHKPRIFAAFKNPGRAANIDPFKIPGRLLPMHKGGKSSKSPNAQNHPEPRTLKTVRIQHVAGGRRVGAARLHSYLNLVEAELVGKHAEINPLPRRRSLWKLYARLRSRAPAAQLRLRGARTNKICRGERRERKEKKKDKIRAAGEISAETRSLLTNGT